jgi:hypothetical protein
MRARSSVVALVLVGCSGSSNHPPGVTECSDPTCGGGEGGVSATGGTAGSAGAGTGGGGGSAGSGAGGSSGGKSLTGSVAIYADTTFVATNPFTGAGKIGLMGTTRTVGNINAGTWTVTGAASAAVLWADLHATVAGDAMDTLEVVDGTGSGGDVVFGSHNAFEDVVTGLSSAQSINPDRAQIVVKFVDSGSQPVSGIRVNLSAATVAYDAGNAYTDAQGSAPLGATQGRGIAVIVNYSATAFPGGAATIQYVKLQTNTPGSLDLRAANGAITFRTAVVP